MDPLDSITGPARLTFLLGPEIKRAFEDLCAAQDLTVSQVVRRLIAQRLADAGYHARHELARPGSD